MHTNETWDLHLLAIGNVDDRVTLLDRALVDAHVRELTIPTVFELERQHHEILVRIRLKCYASFVVVLVECLVLHISRSREKSSYTIEKCLNTLVLVGRATEHRRHLHRECTLANSFCKFCRSWLLIKKELLHQRIVEICGNFDETVTKILRLVHEVSRDLFLADVGSTFAVEVNSLHSDDIDHPFEPVFEADRIRYECWVVCELLTKLVGYAVRVGTRAVTLIDEGQTRNVVPTHLTIHRDGLRLNTSHRAQHENSTVENAECAFHFHGEVNVAWSIDEVDIVVAPRAIRSGRLDRDAFFALKIH